MDKSNTIFNEKSIIICPRCQQRTVRMPGTGDFQHTCIDSNNVLNQEDKLIIGAWEDYTGSDTNATNRLTQGQENTLQGTRGGIEGGDFIPRNVRGFPINRFRQRQHIEHIEPDKMKAKQTTSFSDLDSYEEK